jgi:peptide/nickel transport system ATP-binding protein
MSPVLEVRNLQVCTGEGAIVDGISFVLTKGEVLALIGESGSGKTTIALALMGHVRSGCRITGGSIVFEGRDLVGLADGALESLRGARIAYIAQSAAAAFNPARTLLDQVVEPAVTHGLLPRRAAEAKAIELFRSLGLPSPDTIGRRYPHQVSGGQLQRLMAAMALITDPALVILDEPTTALDVTTQIDALKVFKKVVRERGVTAVYVSHDLAVVAQMADRILVLQQGTMREMGAAAQILHAPSDPYTQTLMAAAHKSTTAPALGAGAEPAPLLEVKGLSAGYPGGRGLVLQDVNLSVGRGRSLGVIGESGSGKSTLARVIAGLTPRVSGEVLVEGEPLAQTVGGRRREQLRRIQIVFQNADTALNPAHTVAQALGRPLELYEGLKGPARDARVRELLDLIRLPAAFADRSCRELSGGQKQRINLARALAARPDLVLCDEVTSALDTVVAAAMLDLLAELRRELDLSLIFISHDTSAVRAICDEVAVLYSGRLVETAPGEAFKRRPHHPYTDLLLASSPELRKGWLEERRASALAEPGATPADPKLCRFLARCPVSVPGACDVAPPPERAFTGGVQALCHHSEEELIVLQSPVPPVEKVG